MCCKCVEIERFTRLINRHNRIGTIIVLPLLALGPVVVIVIGGAPLIVYIIVTIVVILALLSALYLIPLRIHLVDNKLIVVTPLRRAHYKVSIIHIADYTPAKIICPVGNRGFFGWWAWCDSSEGPITLIAQYKCRYVYKVITEDGRVIYVCTSEPLY